ncbi:MAG: RsfS/YbeB/iojap family protein [Adlercreutzia equolifaciens]
MDAIIDEIEDKLREEASIKPTHREMSADGSWSLLDYGNIVVRTCSCQRPASTTVSRRCGTTRR